MTSTTVFDIVLVPFPFSDLSAAKRRPCLVLASVRPRKRSEHLVVCMMTSNLQGAPFPHDHVLLDHAAAGLPKPTLARLAKVVTLDASLVVKTIGDLGERDRLAIRGNLSALFRPALARR